ncbi:MAG: ribonuclease Z [Gemmatimonadaceae bacterium]|nr:ribonuclease Z [Gemmatimonadaceae bacterium]
MRLTTIGTGTAAPHPSRVSAAHLVEAGEIRMLLDCGSGAVHRMAHLGVSWGGITHVALTHFHTDHISDLPLLLMGWRWGQLPPRSEPVTIYGPPGTGALLERMAAVYGPWLLAPGFPLTVRDIAPDEVIRLPGGVSMAATAVPHTAESVAYSISEGSTRLVYTGDTGESEALGDWAAGCDLLLAECSLPDAMAIRDHLTPRQVGQLAARARAKRLVLTHFYPPVEAVDIQAEVAEHYAGPTVLAHDGWSIAF